MHTLQTFSNICQNVSILNKFNAIPKHFSSIIYVSKTVKTGHEMPITIIFKI